MKLVERCKAIYITRWRALRCIKLRGHRDEHSANENGNVIEWPNTPMRRKRKKDDND